MPNDILHDPRSHANRTEKIAITIFRWETSWKFFEKKFTNFLVRTFAPLLEKSWKPLS